MQKEEEEEEEEEQEWWMLLCTIMINDLSALLLPLPALSTALDPPFFELIQVLLPIGSRCSKLPLSTLWRLPKYWVLKKKKRVQSCPTSFSADNSMF